MAEIERSAETMVVAWRQDSPPRQRPSAYAAGAYRHAAAGSETPISDHVPTLDEGAEPVIAALTQELAEARREVDIARRRCEHLEELADHHQFLPVLGRRAFTREVHHFLERMAESGVSGTLALFYLSDYEDIHRESGIAAADYALTHMAGQIAGAVRAGDVVGAVGGAGIATLMPTSDTDGAERTVARLSEAFAERPLQRGAERLHPTVIAVSVALTVGDSVEGALEALDRQFRAKVRSG